MPRIRAVSFDAHGTLVLPHPGVGALYSQRARLHGIAREASALDERFVPAFRAVAADSPMPYGADEADARRFWHAVIGATFDGAPTALCDDLFEHFGRGSCWRVLPGVRECLALCRERCLATAVCSNFDGRLHGILADLELHVDAVLTSAEVGAAKPDPAVILAACERLGVEPAQLLHIGDNPREDAPAAAAAGCRLLAVERGTGIEPEKLATALA